MTDDDKNKLNNQSSTNETILMIQLQLRSHINIYIHTIEFFYSDYIALGHRSRQSLASIKRGREKREAHEIDIASLQVKVVVLATRNN
jgi:hypothetical protein